jgi:ribose-phosphate pyrophosphokinase
MNIIGDVKDHHCIIVDDIIDSGGTICNAAQALIDVGALSVDSYVTHGVLSGSAVTNISNSPLSSLVTTDSIKATEAVKMTSNIRQISIAPIIGEAIRRVHMEQSVSSLFE